MLPRPSLHLARPPCLSGARIPHPQHRPPHPPQTSPFHTTTTRQLPDSSVHSHYETLQLTPTATPADIKRQFFTLSKQHHPDKNPSDPTASTRFVQISEAYHVLSVPEKRAQYDAHLSSSASRPRGGGAAPPQGSYSSASYAGSRPATGLNKRRTTFQGPPPSFYKTGGYGRHSAKRTEHAHHQHPSSADQSQSTEDAAHDGGEGGFGPYGGFGPGQTGQGNEVPHFDGQRHKQTHDHVIEHIYRRRRRTRKGEVPEEMDRGGTLINFLLVSGAIGLIGLSAKLVGDRTEGASKKKHQSS